MGQQREVNVFGTQGYHKGYVNDRYTFPVLAIDKLSKEDKEVVRATTKTLTTAREASGLVGQNGWTYENLDNRGRVGVLKNKGVEVALFFERQMIMEQPAPGDPLPERVLEDPVNLFQRLDIIGPSAKQANLFIKREVEQAKEKVELLENRVQNLQALADEFESQVHRKQQAIEGLNDRIAKIYQKHLPDDRIVAMVPGYKYMTAAKAKEAKAKLVRAAKAKAAKLARAKAKEAAEEAAKQAKKKTKKGKP